MEIETVNMILYCKKWKETVAFYMAKLGLPLINSFDWFVELELNDKSRLSIADESRTSIKSSNGAGITISLQINHIDTIHRKLRKAGVCVSNVKNHPWNAKVFYAHDPEGNRVEFWEKSKIR